MVQLAEALGISSQGYLSNLETGRRKPPTDLAIKIADFFEVSLDQLLRDDLELD
jgi:transcriptional regulator with XRE-family HTH domain